MSLESPESKVRMELGGGHGGQCLKPEDPCTGTYAQKHLASLLQVPLGMRHPSAEPGI